MRVLVVTNAYPTAARPGSGVFVAEQVRGLEAHGVDVRVLHVDRLGDGMGVYRSLPARLSRSVAGERPDLVHVRYGGVMAEIATRAVSDRPVLVTFCGSDLLGSRAEPPLRRLAIAYGVSASRRAARRAGGVVVVSPTLADALPPRIPRDRLWILPDAVDLARFTPLDADACRARLGWNGNRRHILFPSDPSRVEKRFPLARAAVDRLAQQVHDVELHALVDVPHEEVPLWMNASDAVVLTSTHEGSPNVVKEALACNVRVISVEVGDVRDLLAGIDGCGIALPTPEDIADKLAQAITREGRVRSRDRVEVMSLERTSARLVAIYGVLLGSSDGHDLPG